MISPKCKEICMCANCVLNPFYAINTPKPCSCADCDICAEEGETFECWGCSGHLTLEDLNKKIAEGC